MNQIKIIVKGQNDQYPTRETIVPADSLHLYQQTFGNRLLNYFPVDKDGNPIAKGNAPQSKVINPVTKEEILAKMQARALQALYEKAEKLKIKGFKRMKEPALLAAIQEATNAETKDLNTLQTSES